MNIEAIAKEAGGCEYANASPLIERTFVLKDDQITRFAHLIREAVVQELVAGSGEPWRGMEIDGVRPAYYTADQLAGAVLRKEQQMLAFIADAELREKRKQFQSGAAIRSGE